MVIDTLKCVGCSDCVVACQTENDVPIGYCRDWITETVNGSYPNLDLELKSERCNHCDNAPCVRCCPTGASHSVEGGIVLVTADECIGCGACVQTCPEVFEMEDSGKAKVKAQKDLPCVKNAIEECPVDAISK